MKFNSDACKECKECKVINVCPTNAFIIKNDKVIAIDRTRCFNCGSCVQICTNAFNLDMKSIEFDGNLLPIVLRQSDRYGAIKLAEELKTMIIKGDFPLKEPTGPLDFAESIK
jgi:Fe-S-cluster-containing hydrogenase component 2